jgi:hypothetical protein
MEVDSRALHFHAPVPFKSSDQIMQHSSCSALWKIIASKCTLVTQSIFIGENSPDYVTP